MKTAIYIEDGVVQLVITPETEFEKNSLQIFYNKPMDAKLFEGEFYDCRGGWVRQKQVYFGGYTYGSEDKYRDRSLILRMGTKDENTNSQPDPV